MNQKKRILNHLRKEGYITSWEAIKEYGCTRLSQYIYLLRNDGLKITDRWEKSVNRYGDKVKFKGGIDGYISNKKSK